MQNPFHILSHLLLIIILLLTIIMCIFHGKLKPRMYTAENDRTEPLSYKQLCKNVLKTIQQQLINVFHSKNKKVADVYPSVTVENRPNRFIWQIRMESLLCARHCARHHEYKWRVSLSPAKELTIWWEMDFFFKVKEGSKVNNYITGIESSTEKEMNHILKGFENVNIKLYISWKNNRMRLNAVRLWAEMSMRKKVCKLNLEGFIFFQVLCISFQIWPKHAKSGNK